MDNESPSPRPPTPQNSFLNDPGKMRLGNRYPQLQGFLKGCNLSLVMAKTLSGKTEMGHDMLRKLLDLIVDRSWCLEQKLYA